MSDDKANRGGADRGRVAGGDGYEVGYFARKHGISVAQAEELIREHENSRERFDAAAGKLKGGSPLAALCPEFEYD